MGRIKGEKARREKLLPRAKEMKQWGWGYKRIAHTLGIPVSTAQHWLSQTETFRRIRQEIK